MKNIKRILLIFSLLFTLNAAGQESHKPIWSAIYFTIYDHEIARYHSLGFGISTKDARIHAGFTLCKNTLWNSFNYNQDANNYFNSGNAYGAFLKPEADLFNIGKYVKLSVSSLVNYTSWKLNYSNAGLDTAGAIIGYSGKQTSHTFQFYYGLNAEVQITRQLSLGAGVLAKFLTWYGGRVDVTNLNNNITNTYSIGLFEPLDTDDRWLYPSAFLRYHLSCKR